MERLIWGWHSLHWYGQREWRRYPCSLRCAELEQHLDITLPPLGIPLLDQQDHPSEHHGNFSRDCGYGEIWGAADLIGRATLHLKLEPPRKLILRRLSAHAHVESPRSRQSDHPSRNTEQTLEPEFSQG